MYSAFFTFPPDTFTASRRYVIRGQRGSCGPDPTGQSAPGVPRQNSSPLTPDVRSNRDSRLFSHIVWQRKSAMYVLLNISTTPFCCSWAKPFPASGEDFFAYPTPPPVREPAWPANCLPKPYGHCSRGRLFLLQRSASGLYFPATGVPFHSATRIFYWNRELLPEDFERFFPDAKDGQLFVLGRQGIFRGYPAMITVRANPVRQMLPQIVGRILPLMTL